jgi:hypothetical protein
MSANHFFSFWRNKTLDLKEEPTCGEPLRADDPSCRHQRAVAIPDDRLQAPPIGRRNLDADPFAHARSTRECAISFIARSGKTASCQPQSTP